MLKKRLQQYISELLETNENKIELYKDEKAYAEKQRLIPDGVEVSLKEEASRFSDAYLERCEKETIALILVETPQFLDAPIDHLKKHRREFVYVESNSFERIGVDAISLELDDVFETYTALFGLKLQKKYEHAIKAFLENNLDGEEATYSIAFSQKDGLWDVNIALNFAEGYKEDMTLIEAYQLVYHFIFSLLEAIEENA